MPHNCVCNACAGYYPFIANSHIMAEDLFAFLKKPSLSAAAVPETSPSVIDDFDSRLKGAFCLPSGFPKDTKPENVVRFHYRQTNNSQAKTEFQYILNIYRHHVLTLNSYSAERFAYLADYLTNDPLGQVTYPDSDTRIFKNATRLVAALQSGPAYQPMIAAVNAAAAEVTASDTTATSLTEAEAAVSATTPATTEVTDLSGDPKPASKKRRKSKKAREREARKVSKGGGKSATAHAAPGRSQSRSCSTSTSTSATRFGTGSHQSKDRVCEYP